MNSLEIMVKEYDALRQEILATMNNRISILSFGMGIVGAIFTFSIAAYAKQPSSLVTSLSLVLAIPFICMFVLSLWFGEYQRMQRAGQFLVKLEREINLEASKEILTWETYLRKQHFHMKHPYNSTILLFIAISGASQVIGLINISIVINIKWALVTMGIIFHLILYSYMVYLISKLQRYIAPDQHQQEEIRLAQTVKALDERVTNLETIYTSLPNVTKPFHLVDGENY